jgi:SAM-dependent methyltransferase
MDEYRIKLTNNYERAVFLKGDEVHARESARYQWASRNLLGAKVLDIGCSTGYGGQFLPKGIQYTGLDYDPTIIDVAKQQGWDWDCQFLQADINQIELEQYDTIIAFEIIEHMDNGLEVLEKLKKHCKRLLFTTPHNEPKGFWGEHHKLHGLNESHFQGFDFEYTNEYGLITKYMIPVSQSNQFNLLMGKWNREKILCSLPTKGRYFTTLPLVIEAIANQSRKPDKLIIFDDNDEPKDMRYEFLYQHLFWLLNSKKIDWEWLFADKKGQHHIHQRANIMGYDWVWRCDDDAIPEPNVLEVLSSYCNDGIGAVGGSVINPPNPPTFLESTGLIDNIDIEPNIQWGIIKESKPVEHLYSTFLYRAGVHDYNLGLSRVAHREETLFTHGLHRKGYKLLVVPNAVTWHLKNPQGGIRDNAKQEMFEHDEKIYKNILGLADKTIVVLDAGLGDHIVFSKILADIPNPIVFGCYPEVIPCKSIADAHALFGNLDQWNIYRKMAEWNWTDSLENAYRKLYDCHTSIR